MAMGWKSRAGAVGIVTVGLLATGAATGTASAATRVMDAVFVNETGCSLGLVSATPGDRNATWAQEPPATMSTWGSWSVKADLGLLGSVNGSVDYVTKQCPAPEQDGKPVRYTWKLTAPGINYYGGSTGARDLVAGLAKPHHGLNPIFILTPYIG